MEYAGGQVNRGAVGERRKRKHNARPQRHFVLHAGNVHLNRAHRLARRQETEQRDALACLPRDDGRGPEIYFCLFEDMEVGAPSCG